MEIKEKPLTPETLMRLGMEESPYAADHWSDIDGYVCICPLPDHSYQQYYESTEQLIGIPMHTVGQLQLRYYALTGHQLSYYEGDGYPRNQ